MSLEQKKMHLGAFILHIGSHIAGWRDPEAMPEQMMNFRLYEKLVKTAERGKFDMIFLPDNVGIFDKFNTNIKHTVTVRPEPLVLLSYLSSKTKHVGLAATVSTSYNEPFNIARQFSTLDIISNGRSGWNVVISGNDEEAQNFNQDSQLSHSERYEKGRVVIKETSRLWREWDSENGMLGHPVIIQSGSSDIGQTIAAQTADVMFTASQYLDEAKQFYKEIKEKVALNGRNPDSLLIMPGLCVVVEKTANEAKKKYESLQKLVHPNVAISMLSHALNFDFTCYPSDSPVPDLSNLEGIGGGSGKDRFKMLLKMAKKENLSILELASRVTGSRGHRTIYGNPIQIADEMEEWFCQKACDGFNIMPPYLPGGIENFVDYVIPELQKRGLFRSEYEGITLRDHLFNKQM
jgi:alkanesulfonate monooxygenase SsuD/methylene tetrahydromethanopterin reductase-like flavin-dependent oxidoreductase (luciferase family)